jgi:hypothetical protein
MTYFVIEGEETECVFCCSYSELLRVKESYPESVVHVFCTLEEAYEYVKFRERRTTCNHQAKESLMKVTIKVNPKDNKWEMWVEGESCGKKIRHEKSDTGFPTERDARTDAISKLLETYNNTTFNIEIDDSEIVFLFNAYRERKTLFPECQISSMFKDLSHRGGTLTYTR